jgi:hypothetical protein
LRFCRTRFWNQGKAIDSSIWYYTEFCRTRFWNQGKAILPIICGLLLFCRTRFWNQGKAKPAAKIVDHVIF